MSGGEIAGLALGTVALASIFQSCVELFDYFQLAKNCIEDQQFASLKVDLLRERLRTWGRDLNVLNPGDEDSVLRRQWRGKSDIIIKSLLGLRSTLAKSNLLIQRYKASEHSRRSVQLRIRTIWAIHDRNKLERLVQDISFLIDNIERITDRTSAPRRQRANMSPTETVSRRDDQRNDETTMTDGDTGNNPDALADDGLRSQRGTSHKRAQGGQQYDMPVIRQNQQRLKSGTFGVIGGVDSSGSMIIEGNNQDVSDRSSGLIGVMSGPAFDRAHARSLQASDPKPKMDQHSGNGNFRGIGEAVGGHNR